MRCVTFAMLMLGGLVSGCTAMGRENHSLIIRKEAHRYREFTPRENTLIEQIERAEADPVRQRRAVSWGEDIGAHPVLRGLVESPLSDLEPFSPFTYCYLHKSSHVMESIVALPLAPIEYPLAVGINVGVSVVRALAEKIREFFRWCFPYREGPDIPPPRESDLIPRR